MDDQLNMPHDVYTRLVDAAHSEGTTPVGWIEQRLPEEAPPSLNQLPSMYDLFKDVIGKYHSGGKERLAERHSEVFGEILEQKRREGRL